MGFLLLLCTLYAIPYTLFLTGCCPTYPKADIEPAVIKLCKQEYKINVSAKVYGSTLAVFLPAENLFDAVLNLDAKASKKINDVILGVSRVTLSTDARFDFYIVIAQDPKATEVEIVYIRYVDDVKRFLLGDISRDEYARRAVIMLKTPPQAEREKILRDLFVKLNVEKPDDMVKEYMENETSVSGIGEISYWDGKFFMKDVGLAEFLAVQAEERMKMEFRQNSDLNKWYELKNVEGRFIKNKGSGYFIFNVNMADRVTPLYLDSGIEVNAQRKKNMLFQRLFKVAGDVLWAYKSQDFERVDIDILAERKSAAKNTLWGIRTGKIKIGDLK